MHTLSETTEFDAGTAEEVTGAVWEAEGIRACA